MFEARQSLGQIKFCLEFNPTFYNTILSVQLIFLPSADAFEPLSEHTTPLTITEAKVTFYNLSFWSYNANVLAL